MKILESIFGINNRKRKIQCAVHEVKTSIYTMFITSLKMVFAGQDR